MTNTPKLAIAIGYIDDDLVIGAVEYMPAHRKKITHYGKYIVAAACFCVIVTVLFFMPQNDVLPPIDDVPSTNNQGDIIVDTPQITVPIVDNIILNDVSFIPVWMLPYLGEENCIAMSSEEMFEYYGINIASRLASIGSFYETKCSYPHGLYTFSDGIFDINHFVFDSEDGMQEIEFYIGKTTNCGRFASNLSVDKYERSKINGVDIYVCQYKDVYETCLFSILQVNGCDVVVLSYNIDEQTFVSVLKSLTCN